MGTPSLFAALAFFSASLLAQPAAPRVTVFNILDFGAVPDGKTKNTSAIAMAIAACTAAGGGTVWVPAGKFLTGTVMLESNLTLHLEAGAELPFSGDPADAPIVPSRWECINVCTHAPLIYANGKQNIALTGRGMFQGHGAVVIGSETAGGIRNITASNCVSVGTDCGIRIKSQRGRGGVLENFRFANWVIEDAKKQAFEINTRYTPTPDAPLSEKPPIFRNFSYSNITMINAAQIAKIVGLPEKAIAQLRFTDITATGKTGFNVDCASDLELPNVRLHRQWRRRLHVRCVEQHRARRCRRQRLTRSGHARQIHQDHRRAPPCRAHPARALDLFLAPLSRSAHNRSRMLAPSLRITCPHLFRFFTNPP